MIMINKNYLHLFKKIKNGYIYPASKGSYLYFNKKLVYESIETFYVPFDYKRVDKQGEEKIVELISKGILEVID